MTSYALFNLDKDELIQLLREEYLLKRVVEEKEVLNVKREVEKIIGLDQTTINLTLKNETRIEPKSGFLIEVYSSGSDGSLTRMYKDDLKDIYGNVLEEGFSRYLNLQADAYVPVFQPTLWDIGVGGRGERAPIPPPPPSVITSGEREAMPPPYSPTPGPGERIPAPPPAPSGGGQAPIPAPAPTAVDSGGTVAPAPPPAPSQEPSAGQRSPGPPPPNRTGVSRT